MPTTLHFGTTQKRGPSERYSSHWTRFIFLTLTQFGFQCTSLQQELSHTEKQGFFIRGSADASHTATSGHRHMLRRKKERKTLLSFSPQPDGFGEVDSSTLKGPASH